jgi:hypothetical protein
LPGTLHTVVTTNPIIFIELQPNMLKKLIDNKNLGGANCLIWKNRNVVYQESNYSSMPCAGSIGSVGWPGAYGGWWSADLTKKTVALFLTHSMTELAQLAKDIGFRLFEAIDMFSTYTRQII